MAAGTATPLKAGPEAVGLPVARDQRFDIIAECGLSHGVVKMSTGKAGGGATHGRPFGHTLRSQKAGQQLWKSLSSQGAHAE